MNTGDNPSRSVGPRDAAPAATAPTPTRRTRPRSRAASAATAPAVPAVGAGTASGGSAAAPAAPRAAKKTRGDKRPTRLWGVLSTVLGGLLPLATLFLYLTRGFDVVYWLPVIFLLWPVNGALALIVIAALVLGIVAILRGAPGRLWGCIGLYLVALQILFFSSLIITTAMVVPATS